MYTQRKIHSGFIGSLVLLATFLLIFFHTRPAQQKLNEMKKSLNNLQGEIQLLTGQTATSVGEKSLTEIEQKELNQAVPVGLHQETIILDLNRMAQQTDISFQALSFTLQPDKPMPTVNISGGFRGGSEHIKRFLKMVEGNQRKFIVQDIGLSSAEGPEGLELVDLNLTLQAFYRNENHE